MSSSRGRWVHHGERTVWSSSAFDLNVADVSAPDGRRLEHVVLRAHSEAACFAADHAGQVLMLLRYRLPTRRWGWELPMTTMRDGEDAVAAAVRVVHDDGGWSVDQPRLLWSMARWPERCDLLGHVVVARASRRVGLQRADVAQVGWFDSRDLRQVLAAAEVQDVFTAAALHWWLAWA